LPEYVSPSGAQIEQKDTLRDLGVIMSQDCSFKQHIQSVISKANKMAGWALRTFKTRDRNVMMTLYKQLVLCQLEYCCPVWSPSNAASIGALEAVQRSFTRRINGMTGKDRPDYWARLKMLKMYSLERRRERYTIIYMWKILHTLVPNPGVNFKFNARTGIHIQLPDVGGSCHIAKLRRDSVLYKGPRLFNTLPVSLRQSVQFEPNLQTFKSKLDKFLNTVPDQPTVSGLIRAASSNSVIDQVNYLLLAQ
jgi:hypothetical protein